MVKNTKTWMSWKQKIIFLRNGKIIQLCLRWHILRSCHFASDVPLNCLWLAESIFYMAHLPLSGHQLQWTYNYWVFYVHSFSMPKTSQSCLTQSIYHISCYNGNSQSISQLCWWFSVSRLTLYIHHTIYMSVWEFFQYHFLSEARLCYFIA